MSNLVKLWEVPTADEIYMLAGWEQWADAGAISSGLPDYLIHFLHARQIGEITSEEFYLFQLPGTHHFLRPRVKLREGHRQHLSSRTNRFFYAETTPGRGLVIFLGDEPHLQAHRYAEAFLDAVQRLNVRRVGAVGGVYGAMPYDKSRRVSCVYSLPEMKEGLSKYAVHFSNYEGGATIGTYLADRAEARGVEMVVFYAFVPAYDFSEDSSLMPGIRIETDYRAWYELMRRFDHMFQLGLDLSDLKRRSEKLTFSMDAEIAELAAQFPQLEIYVRLAELTRDFQEKRFVPLGDLWEEALRDIFGSMEGET